MDWNDLSGWLLWLVVGAVLVWMMRKGGCGMHGRHKHSAAGPKHHHGDEPIDGTPESGSNELAHPHSH